ncbi:hypothetical protein [Kutzneria kofuensis]|uniref:Deazaflavin-dependent oxidoreductase (Nitroreductase family) n=1 Tax=Kutzneria kofuensis TaxID=103725 RepID=A0A7W9NMK3_9PSEU|nr:hypothetical protein [Kutzneria kofuensis]MBB5897443.1 hypothetical protein [Kutzneria kofuensis]
MSFQGTTAGRVITRFNGVVDRLRSSRLLGPLVGRYLTVVSYTGRRSGRTFRTPVGYRRTGDVVSIQVMLADTKNWWRNFTGDGGPLTLDLPGDPVTGHAVAERVRENRVNVTVRL